MHPDQNLNAYLTLVERLNNKIDQIKFSIGTDQSVLGEEANPKEFIDIYSPATDGDVINQDDDDDELLGEDQFVKDLREFHSSASQLEKDLVSSIGVGKWGYLPTGFSQHIQSAEALALVRVEGKLKQNSQDFTSHIFIRKIQQYSPVENFAALSALRVANVNTDRRLDLITLDRVEIKKKVIQLAKLHASKQVVFIKRTPKVIQAIGAFSKYKFEGVGLDLALDKVQTIQSLKRAKQIIKLVNREVALKGILSSEVVDTVQSFIKQMMSLEDPGYIFESGSIEGVVYFAS
jgi:hypothetical protein